MNKWAIASFVAVIIAWLIFLTIQQYLLKQTLNQLPQQPLQPSQPLQQTEQPSQIINGGRLTQQMVVNYFNAMKNRITDDKKANIRAAIRGVIDRYNNLWYYEEEDGETAEQARQRAERNTDAMTTHPTFANFPELRTLLPPEITENMIQGIRVGRHSATDATPMLYIILEDPANRRAPWIGVYFFEPNDNHARVIIADTEIELF